MDWNKDTVFEVVLTNEAETAIQKILDYIFFELGNAQAAYSVEQDMRETIGRLYYVAGNLRLCDDPELRAQGYRTIHLKRHKYFILYKVVDNHAYVVSVYHDLQDYENTLK